jgi:filamentous hemagglutinin family protein
VTLSNPSAPRFHARALLRWVLMLVLFLSAPFVGATQVATNITPTRIAPLDLSTNVDTAGSTTHITGGTRPGNGTNLFHSFDSFTLGTGDVAHFMNDMQLPTTNIVGRVIGGEVSTIDGTLRTNNPLNAADPMNFGSANLWLVNPSGLLLGPNARVEVGGSVSMSTANYLRFESTAALFDMLSSPASLGPLSVAPVAAFGFLGPAPPAPITVQGSTLQVPEGQALSLVGGDITIQSGTLGDGTIQAASLRAPGGQLNLVSVASPGEVLVPSFQTGSFTTMGTVMLKEGGTLDVSGQLDEFGSPIGNGNSGTVFVRGGKLVMDASTILATTMGAVDGANTAVDIQVSQKVALTNGSTIATFTVGPRGGGDVQLAAGTLTMENAASIVTGSFDGGGVGGDVVLNVGTLRLMGGASIQTLSQNFSPGLGRGGTVTIQAKSVALSGGSSLLSQTFGSGDGGRISITAKSLDLDEVSTINSSTSGTGRGGDIVASVQQASLSGQGSGIRSEAIGEGHPGDIEVHAKTVNMTDGAVIQAGTPVDTGTAGNVTIDADSVGISGGSRIINQTFATDGGQVTIMAKELTLDKGSIEANTSGIGRGGDVVLDVGSISLSNGATINSSSAGFEADAGDAGNVTITSSGAFTSNASTIATSAEYASGGNIDVKAQSVALSNGAVMSASSQSPLLPDGGGNAGNIAIQSGSTVVMHNSSITTEASQASGGHIMITAPEMVRLINSQVSTSVAGNPVDITGGNITIDPQFMILQNSQIIAQAFAGAGSGVFITADIFLVDLASTVDSSGSQRTSHPSSPISELLSPMSQQLSRTAALLLTQRCAADPTGHFSSFVQTGRDGVPQVPGALSPSPLSFLETLTSSSLGSPSPNWAASRLGLDSVRVADTTRFHSTCRS